MGIGKRNGRLPAGSITLFKLKLHDELACKTDEQIMDSDFWDFIIDSGTNERYDAKSQLQQFLKDSESVSQQQERLFLRFVWGKNAPYKEAQSKEYKNFEKELLKAELDSISMFYFCVRDLQTFLRKNYQNEDSNDVESARYSSAIFCNFCFKPFFSDKNFAQLLDSKCNSKYFSELLPKESPFHSDAKVFTNHAAKQRARVSFC